MSANSNGDAPIDLEERTARFGEAIIDLVRKVRRDCVSSRLISQLVGASTSVGANYCEADEAVSRREYKVKIGYCKKEARESKHFLRMIARAAPQQADEARKLWIEAKELHLIFCSIYRRTRDSE